MTEYVLRIPYNSEIKPWNKEIPSNCPSEFCSLKFGLILSFAEYFGRKKKPHVIPSIGIYRTTEFLDLIPAEWKKVFKILVDPQVYMSTDSWCRVYKATISQCEKKYRVSIRDLDPL